MNKYDEREVLKNRWKVSPGLFMHQVVGLKPYEYQTKMLNFKGILYKDGRVYQAVILPRDSGKSELGTIGEAIWYICHNPNIVTQIIAETIDLAMDFLSAIKMQFEQNKAILEVYGDHKGKAWSAKRIISKQRNIVRKEATVQCLGAGGAVVGRHVDIQWLDDVVSKKNSRTPELREELKDWYVKLICPILNPGGIQKIRGTRYYHQDLYSFLRKAYGSEAFFTLKSLTKDENGNYVSYCPERYSVENLLAIKQRDLVAFLTQYQNETSILVSNIIGEGNIITVDEREIPPWEELTGFMGLDPAIKKKDKTDPFSLHTLGVHKATGLIYLLRQVSIEGVSKPDDPYTMLEIVLKEWHYLRSRGLQVWAIGAEANAFQALLHNVVRNNAQKYGMLPFIEVYNLRDKSQRLHAIAHYFTRKLVRVDGSLDTLIEQLAQFPDVEKDDEVDSMMNAFQVMEETGTEALGLPIDIIGDMMKEGKKGSSIFLGWD